MIPSLSPAELTGRAETHVVEVPQQLPLWLHRSVVGPWRALQAAAKQDGFDLQPASSFRSFQHQLRIWNAKFRGERALRDRSGAVMDPGALSDGERIDAILLWSALPGASRHHWGTEVDVFDRAALAEGQRPQLLAQEHAPGGVFAELTAWLDVHAAAHGFFRPYDRDRGGVQPEAWHLSYAPVACGALQQLGVQLLREALDQPELQGRGIVLSRIQELHRRYVLGVADPPPAAAHHA